MEKFMLQLELRYREVKNGDDYYRTPKIVRDSMVAKWRELGYRCLQVADGKF